MKKRSLLPLIAFDVSPHTPSDGISEYMIERDEESNINEEISSYNPGRVQDGGYMNKVRN
ncbi:hypothetical protein MTR_8g019400 [Medicago truncatula]|uniref:Uncharacterized protein n=1 Tax=Medicago truncatula TaxID=3880 RepID=A0A072TLR7_MEDTR|nr:hypothetical protein MTR_8g019400 [Medicago truncatula]